MNYFLLLNSLSQYSLHLQEDERNVTPEKNWATTEVLLETHHENRQSQKTMFQTS